MASQISYNTLVDIVANYYGTTSLNVIDSLNKYGAEQSVENLIKLLPEQYNYIYNVDGSIRTMSYTHNALAETSEALGNAIDSNIASNTNVAINTPITTSLTETGKLSFKSGLKSVGNFITKEVAPAIMAVGVGISLGKAIDSALYNLNPDFWDSHGMAELNPQTWNSIASNDGLGGFVFNTIFGLHPDTKESQQYIDENAFAYMAMYMQNKGVFEKGSGISSDLNTGNLSQPLSYVDGERIYYIDTYGTTRHLHSFSGAERIFAYRRDNGRNFYAIGVRSTPNENFPRSYVYNGKTVYYTSVSGGVSPTYPFGEIIPPYEFSPVSGIPSYLGQTAWTVMYGETKGGYEGITDQPNADLPDFSGLTTSDQYLNYLKNKYPYLWENSVEQTVVQPDGSEKTYTYIPVGTPDSINNSDTKPTTGNQTQNNTIINPSTFPMEQLQKLVDSLTKTDTTEPDIGSGTTPPVIVPIGSASALYTIYNPTQSELNQLGGFLWSNNFVDQLLKLFNDPMQAIIGLHKVFVPPSISGRNNIKVGYLDSGVNSNVVGGQYVTINCGSVKVSEVFNNVFDYEPYTKIHLFLPFIGIVDLSVSECMRSTISIIYHADVITGACLAEVKVIRDSSGGNLYTFTGNCAVQYPVSSGTYIGIITGAIGAIGSVAMGNPLTALGSLTKMRTNVNHSGSFSGNAGAMGGKIPYLIIERPQTDLANTFPQLMGYPSNTSTLLKNCNGFVRVKEVHVDNINATSNELTEIESLLKSGIII